MREIKLTHGHVAMVDDDDFEKINQFRWRVWNVKGQMYAVRSISQRPKTALTVLMHRVIMNVDESSIEIDHIDHNGLNNQKLNLRKATRSQNARNKRSLKGSTSNYLGVFFHDHEKNKLGTIVTRKKKWCARIGFDGKSYNLGRYNTEIEAARAYNEAAKKHHGEFANLNSV
jgi:hypothetical protein